MVTIGALRRVALSRSTGAGAVLASRRAWLMAWCEPHRSQRNSAPPGRWISWLDPQEEVVPQLQSTVSDRIRSTLPDAA